MQFNSVDTHPTKRSKRNIENISSLSASSASFNDILLAPLIMCITNFIPKHLSLRLVSKQFDEAIRTLHRIDECSKCRAVCSSFHEFVGIRLCLPWMPNFRVTEDFSKGFSSVESSEIFEYLDPSNPAVITQSLDLCEELEEDENLVPLRRLYCRLGRKAEGNRLKTREKDILALFHHSHLSELQQLEFAFSYPKEKIQKGEKLAKAFLSSPCLGNLKSFTITPWLNLPDSSFIHQIVSSPSFLSHVTELRMVSDDTIRDEDIHALSNNPSATNLQVLDIDSSALNHGYQHIAASPYLTSLNTLKFRQSSDLTDANMTILGSSANMTSVTSLYIHNQDYYAGGVQALGNSKNFANLKSLTLVNIDLEALTDFASALYLTNLRTLFLWDIIFDQESAEAIGNSENLNSVRRLGISACDGVLTIPNMQASMLGLLNGTGLQSLQSLWIQDFDPVLKKMTAFKRYILQHPRLQSRIRFHHQKTCPGHFLHAPDSAFSKLEFK